MRAAAPLTAHEFLELALPDRGRMELVEGDVVMSDPTAEHQLAVKNVVFALESWARSESGGGLVMLNIDCLLDDSTVLQPDVQWYADPSRLGPRRERPQPLGDLVVEVRSPSTWALDVGPKRAAYERGGVAELWLVDPLSRTVLVYRRSRPGTTDFDVSLDLGGGDSLTSGELDGFALPVAAIFD